MTPTTAQVTLSLDAQQYFAGLSRAGAEAKVAAGRISASFDAAATAARSLAGVFAAGFSARAFVQAADSVTVLNNQLKLATGSQQEAVVAQAALFDIAQRSRVSFTELGGTYAQIARASGELGLSQTQLLTVTEAIGNAMTISGGDAGGMNAALMQLSQGLASGTLRGEELNSVMEQTPRLARALADGLGVPIGKLREMGAAGELTADKVIAALQSQAEVLRGEMAGSATTAAQSMQVLGNSATALAAELSDSLGVGNGLNTVLGEMSRMLDEVTRASRESGDNFNVMNGLVGFLRTVLETVVLVGSDVVFVFKGVGREIGGIAAQLAALATLDVKGFTAISDAMREDATRARAELDRFQRRIVDPTFAAPAADDQTSAEARRLGLTRASSPVALPVSAGGKKAGKAGRSAAPKDPEADAKRYLENLQKQLQATRDLSVEETLLADIQAGRLGKVEPEREKELRNIARQIDDARTFAEIDKDMERAKLDTARATAKAREEQEKLLQAMLDATPTAQLEKQREEMQLLAKAFEDGRITAEQFGEAANTRLGNVAKDVDKANESAKAFGQIMNSAFEDAIISGGKLSDVVKGLIADLARMALRKSVTEPLAQAASGWIGSFIDGFRADGGPVSAGKTYMVGERGPELFSPATSGFITPNHALSGGGGAGGGVTVVQNISIDARGADASVDQKILAAMRQTKQETLAAVQLSANRGGSFAASVGRA